MSEDREGDALDREIAHDKIDAKARARRRVLFIPPLLALGVAAWALAMSRPRDVYGARVIVGPKPLDGPLHARVQLFRATPGYEDASVVTGVEVRVLDNGARGRASSTDDRGVSEVVIDAPLPMTVTLEAKIHDRFQPVGSIPIATLPAPDPRRGILDVRRNGGAVTGDLRIDVASELGALAPPVRGAAWIRVRDKKGLAVPNAIVTVQADGGLSGEIAPTKTDAGGLARIPLIPIATPVALTVTAELADKKGSWSGIVGSVMGAPTPRGDGRLRVGQKTLDLISPSTHGSAYIDVWQNGVRIGGGKVALEGGYGSFPLPEGISGVIDVETSPSPHPASADDLAHAATWPLVIAKDDVDAWGAVAASPRFPERLTPAGTLADYGTAVVASIAFAPPAIPPRSIVADGLEPEMKREGRRGKTVRGAASVAVVAGGLAEFGLMLWLGVFGRPPTVADAMRELGEEVPKESESPRRWLGVLLTGIGIVALLFASMAIMAWGMP